METTIIKIDPAEFGLENDKAVEVESAFAPVIVERDALLEVYQTILTSEMSEQLTEDAHQLRLKLVKVRTSTDKVHRVQKAFYLAGGRFVDAWKTRNNTVIEQMEERLSEIENYYINIEKECIEKLRIERMGLLSEVSDTPELFQVELMTEQAFNSLLEGQKLAKQARIAAEKKAEEDRLAEIEAERIENERIRKENERLQAESESKEKQIESERKSAAAKLKAEQDSAEAARLKAQAEAEAVLKVEREKAQKLADELAAKQAAELKAKQDAELSAKKAAAAPLKAKVTVWIDSLTMPEMGDDKTVTDIRTKFEGFKSWAKTQLINL
jgi:hypothetical protein